MSKYSKTQYISLNPESPKADIIKFQKFFKALKIYKGEIDGKYSSIKPDIITFQLKYKIINSEKEYGAGYIGPKTYKFFTDRFGDKFIKAYSKFFQIKEETIKNEKCFVVSAYYSPLRNQKKYATKSYSGDIRLNGNGTHGASGVVVHPGFIAAPSIYPFGTKIELEGLGIGIVEDRGGAIVRKGVRGHECDRLDIWMGYGDDGLNRALKWGKKKVSGKIVNKNTKITITFPSESREYLAIKIKPESSKTDLEKMQKLFSQAELYSGKIDGNYKTFEKAIINFQVENKIIKNKDDYAAGYIGNKTIQKLEEKYSKVFIITRRRDIDKNGIIPEKINISKNSNTITLKNKKTEESLKKYKITLKSKQELDSFNEKINKYFDKKIGNNKLKIKTEKNKLRNKIDKIIKKTKNIKTKAKLTYLKSIIK
ncbi:MAG: 3D domain-containing protein [Candidatus Gracilibacteria bacterium]|nr:3D domain-containing protein [Candidatus Gracilibacteria bacterium]